MKLFRNTLLLLLFGFCQWTQAGQIPVTKHYWEIHKNNGEVIRIPYVYVQELSFLKTDLNGIEHKDYVCQILSMGGGYADFADRIDDISLMKYVKKTEYVETYDDDVTEPTPEVISAKGIDWTLNLPEGSAITHEQGWLEVEEGDQFKIKVSRNNTVFWRHDVLHVTYPNGTTANIPIEQPGDECFKFIDAGATLSANIKTIYSDEDEPWITEGGGIGGYTSGTKDCVFTGKLGDKIHRYTLHHVEITEDGSRRTIDVDVTLDVSYEPGRVRSASITDNQHWINGSRTTDENFSATFDETENNYDFHLYSTSKMPSSWSYSYSAHDSETGRSETATVINNKLLGSEFSVSFTY